MMITNQDRFKVFQLVCQIHLESDELEEMSSKQLCWSLLCGTISGIIAVLVFKLLENKGAAREEIRDVRAEQNDRNKPDKEPQENDERPEKRPEEHGNRLR